MINIWEFLQALADIDGDPTHPQIEEVVLQNLDVIKKDNVSAVLNCINLANPNKVYLIGVYNRLAQYKDSIESFRDVIRLEAFRQAVEGISTAYRVGGYTIALM